MTLTFMTKRFCLIAATCALLVLLFSGTAHAYTAVYGGSGLSPTPISGLSSSISITDIIIKIINFILDLVLIIAVLAVIIAGFYLITSNGDEGQKDKAKTIILYVLIGIIVILLARVIVLFVNNLV